MKQPYLLTWHTGYQRFDTFKEMKDFCVYNGLSYMCYYFSARRMCEKRGIDWHKGL